VRDCSDRQVPLAYVVLLAPLLVCTLSSPDTL